MRESKGMLDDNMAKFKVEIERPLCISCENCINICPEFWEMALDGFSHLKGSKNGKKII